MAGFHAPATPAADSLVASTYKPLLKTGLHKLIGFARREQGLMVRKNNPLRLSKLQDLLQPGVRFVNRPAGTGTRLLLDQWLSEAGLLPAQIAGYGNEEPSHGAVAARIASGHADAGLGIASAAHFQGLDFVPLQPENYWLICLKSALPSPSVQKLQEILASDSWVKRLNRLPGYAADHSCGEIHSLKQHLPWWQLAQKHSPSPAAKGKKRVNTAV
jgi:putative molybdopterin biosynthesis protein